MLRVGRDTDAAGFIALIRDCWAEYPGCVFDLDGELPELRALASYFAEQDGALWVAEVAGAVVGMATWALVRPKRLSRARYDSKALSSSTAPKSGQKESVK